MSIGPVLGYAQKYTQWRKWQKSRLIAKLITKVQMKIWHPIWIFAAFWILPTLWRFFAVCAKQGARWFFAICAKFDIFAKIATLHRATFGIQFESPAFWRFLPFSPLHAFLDISGSGSREYKQWPAALQSSVLPTELIPLRLSLLKLGQRWARKMNCLWKDLSTSLSLRKC